ncbi:hypothetical protein D9M68_614390 [compost metagenome]
MRADIPNTKRHEILEMLEEQSFLQLDRTLAGKFVDDVVRIDVEVGVAGGEVEDTL